MTFRLRKPYTYFRRTGFSINESEFPNMHMSWDRGIYVYIALTRRLKWSWHG